MAIMASKGAVDGVVEEEAFPAPAPAPAPAPEEVLASRDRSVVELEGPRRSPALRREEEPVWGCVEDWIWEAE
jgi:hypothetical protein